MNLHFKACSTVFLANAMAGSAHAAEALPTAIPLDEVVVVAARRAQPTEEVAGSVSVITRREIERQQAQDIADLVRDEPGVAVNREATRFGSRGFSVRGIEGNRVAVRIDGVPLPEGFAVGSFSNAGRDLLDPELIERIELLRGPASSLYGSDALGGIVAIVTRDPHSFIREGTSRSQARLGFDGRDEGVRLGITSALESERWAGLIGLVGRDGETWDNHPEGDGPEANPSESLTRSGLLKLLGRHDFGTSRVILESLRDEVTTDLRTAIAGPGQFSTTESLLGDDRARRQRVVFGLTWDAPRAGLDELDALVYAQASTIEQDTLQRRSAAPPRTPSPTLRARQFELDQAQRGLQLVGRSVSTHGPVEASWVFGLEYSRNRIEERRDGVETNLDTGASTNVVLGEVLPVRDFPNSVQSVTSAFVSGELGLGDSGYSLLPGLRWDRFEVDARQDGLFEADFPNLELFDVTDQRVTPKLALRREVGEAGQLYLAYAQGFRAPPFSDVNIALNLPGINAVVLPNPGLRAERSEGYEFGLNWQGERVALRAALFENRYRDLIESRANLGSNAGGALVFQSVNRERARIRGVEWDIRASLAGFGEAWSGWQARVTGHWTEGDDTRRDQPLNSISPPRLGVGVDRDALGAWPEFGIQLTAVRGKQRIDESAGPLFAPPGYATLDLRLGKSIGEHWRVDVRLNNVTDQRYWDWLALRGVRPDNHPAPAFYTAAGRNLLFTATRDW